MTGGTGQAGATGRSTGRVVLPGGVLPGQEGAGGQSAPEGVTVLGSSFSQHPEGGRRVSANRLRRLYDSLSARDWSVLHLLNDHNFLTSSQLGHLLFANHASHESGARTCRRVLARLHKERVIEHLERRVGGVRAGSASYIFRVGLVGDQLLRLRAGDGARARRKEPSLRHLDHCLAVADCHVQLAQAARSGLFELLRVDSEPRCWQRYLSAAGVPIILKPDLGVVTASGDYEDHWFLEIDRGTESLPTLLRQCQAYRDYRAAGSHQHGDVFPRVVWVAPDEARRAKIEQAIKRARLIDSDLFRTSTMPTLTDIVRLGAA